MTFYFIVFVFFGFYADSATKITRAINSLTWHAPPWLNGIYGQLSLMIAGLTVIAGLITTLVQYGFLWMIASFLEMALGALIARFLNIQLNVLILMIGPIVSIIFLGAMWGFWYI